MRATSSTALLVLACTAVHHVQLQPDVMKVISRCSFHHAFIGSPNSPPPPPPTTNGLSHIPSQLLQVCLSDFHVQTPALVMMFPSPPPPPPPPARPAGPSHSPLVSASPGAPFRSSCSDTCHCHGTAYLAPFSFFSSNMQSVVQLADALYTPTSCIPYHLSLCAPNADLSVGAHLQHLQSNVSVSLTWHADGSAAS